jgi:DnaJ-class molecular chaperone
MTAWQRCPICLGKGIVFTSVSSMSSICDVCNGEKIIHTTTGLPPSKHKPIVDEKDKQKSDDPTNCKRGPFRNIDC